MVADGPRVGAAIVQDVLTRYQRIGVLLLEEGQSLIGIHSGGALLADHGLELFGTLTSAVPGELEARDGFVVVEVAPAVLLMDDAPGARRIRRLDGLDVDAHGTANLARLALPLARVLGELAVVVELAMLGAAIQVFVDVAVLVLHRLLPGDIEAMVLVPVVHGIDGRLAVRVGELRGRREVVEAGWRCNGAIWADSDGRTGCSAWRTAVVVAVAGRLIEETALAVQRRESGHGRGGRGLHRCWGC